MPLLGPDGKPIQPVYETVSDELKFELTDLQASLVQTKLPTADTCFCNNTGTVYVELNLPKDRDTLTPVLCPFCEGLARLGPADQKTARETLAKVRRALQGPVTQDTRLTRRVSFEEDESCESGS